MRRKLAVNNSKYLETAAKKNHDYHKKAYDIVKVSSSFLQTFVPVKLCIISSLSVMAICLLLRKIFANFFRSCWETYMTQTTYEMVVVLRNFHMNEFQLIILDLPWLDWSLSTKLFYFASHLVYAKCRSPTKNKSTDKCAVSWLVQIKC